jgi:sugar phosphate permease
VGAAISARIVVGLGVAMVFVPTMKILTNWFESEKFVRMTGILMSLGGVGGYMAATPLAYLSEAISWRGAMIVIGGITLGIALAVWLLVRDTPQEMGFQPLNGISSANSANKKISLWRGMGMVLKELRFWPMAMVFFLGATVTLSFSGLWGGPFLMHVYGMSKTQAGGVLSAMAIGLIIGAPVMSWLSDRVLHSRKKVLMINQFSALCLFILLAFFTGNFTKTLLYIWCFSYSFMISGSVVVGYASIKESFPMEISGTATGLINIFPFAGAALGQPLMGWYLDYFGSTGGHYSIEAYSATFKFGLIFIFGAVVSSSLVKETFPKESAAAHR